MTVYLQEKLTLQLKTLKIHQCQCCKL